ncbi:hypothetical protein [Microvirga calopogonii]|uniref:hypothetical protein n=1 Tax=Microvirga calopogonii TaxID=2078013 RepID=UPI0013B405BC|nr:hypothetical protein [Microvirga calopogonii]
MDLLKVQEAANAAHRNFLAVMDVDHRVYDASLLSYLSQFQDDAVPRVAAVKQCAQRCEEKIREFPGLFGDLLGKIATILMKRDLLVGGATVISMALMLKDFSTYLDNVPKRLARTSQDTLGDEDAYRAAVEMLKADAATLGYAVALVEQLGANLVGSRLQTLGDFQNRYLAIRTPAQVIANITSDDVIDVLLEALLASAETLALVGPIKKVLDIWDSKRLPRAGATPGDTDKLFELDEKTEAHSGVMHEVLSALHEAELRADALQARQTAIQASLKDS